VLIDARGMLHSSNRNRKKYLLLLETLLKELSATLDAELRLMQRNPYIALQLSSPPTTVKALKVAYHNMARKYHPGLRLRIDEQPAY
jgi:hypothetical protein